MIISHNKILENWDIFPYKLDYILHLVFINNSNVNDIMLKENNKYFLYPVSQSNKNKFDSENFPITKQELISYFKITTLDKQTDFRYQTEIFSDTYSFRTSVTKDGEMIVLRLLSLNHRFNEFNEKMYSYSLYQKLNDVLEHKQGKEIKVKI